jgi:hypothetical protein
MSGSRKKNRLSLKNREHCHPEPEASVTIVAPGYRAGCTEPICRNLSRMILRHADAGRRPISNS